MSSRSIAASPISALEVECVRRSMRKALFASSDAPHRLGRYELVGLLGSGIHSEIFAAYDRTLRRSVALKLVPVYGDRDRALEEARLLAGLSHSNVVTVFDAGSFGPDETGDSFDRVYVAMELVDGPTLTQWLGRGRDPARPWRDIVRTFLLAGRGLAAVHEAGILHGDFKPDNVVISPQGPKLVDFGLARRRRDADDGDIALRAGTLAYMAPEQHRGSAPTAKSDQYAFCVALHEALTGKPAFDGTTVAELVASKEAFQLQRLSSGRVPRRLWSLLERGLDPNPNARHDALGLLLDELDRCLRRRRTVVAGVFVASVAATGGLLARGSTECVDPSALADSVWTQEDRTSLRSVFAESGLPNAQRHRALTFEAIDAWTETWMSARAEACELDKPDQARQGLCLDHQLVALAEVIDHLESADTRKLRDALSAVRALPPAARCNDSRSRPHERIPEPLARDLIRVTTLYDLGRYEEARATAETMADSVGLGSDATGEVMLALGQARAKTGDAQGAVEALRRAVRAAEATESDERAAMALIRLAWVVGELNGDGNEAATLLSVAEGKLDRIGEAPALRAELETMRGHLCPIDDRPAAAAHYQAAIANYQAAFGPDDRRVAEGLVNLGNALDDGGRPQEARHRYVEALRLWEPLLGPAHPLLASGTSAIGVTYLRRGDAQRAYVFLQAAYDQSVASEGPDARSTLRYAALLGATMAELGSHEAGRDRMRDARTRLERIVEPGDVELARIRINLARAHSTQGQYEEAQRELIPHLAELAQTQPNHPVLGDAWVIASAVHRGRGEPAQAADAASRALELRRRLGQHPTLIAEAQLELGQALESTDPARAVALVTEAHATLVDQAAPAEVIAGAQAWLDAHGS